MDTRCRKATGGCIGRSTSIRGFYVYTTMATKITGWFPHDIDSTDDINIQRIIHQYGAEGYGIWWRVVEILHKHGGSLDFNSLVFLVDRSLGIGRYVDEEDLNDIRTLTSHFIIRKMVEIGLLSDGDGTITSDRIMRNLEHRQGISEKRSQAGRKGAHSKSQASAEQLPSKSQAKSSTLTLTVTDTVKKEDIPPLPPLTGGLDYPEMQRAWSDYVEYRKQRKPKMTPKAAERLFARLEKAVSDGIDPVEALDYAMSQSWQGVFFDKLPSKPKDYDQFRQWVEECYDKQEAMTRYAAYPQGRFAREWWDAMMQSGFTERGHPIKNWRQHVKSYIDQAMEKVTA